MSPRRTTPPPASRSKLKNVGLFKESELEPASNLVFLDKITLPATQPRRYFDPQAMASLVESVKSDGILQPLLVRALGEKYEVVAGERRYRAAQAAELTEVPVVVREMTDEQAVQYALVENLQREDLNPVEETEGILGLLSLRLGWNTAEVTSLLYRMENEAKGKITRKVSGNLEASTVEQVFTGLGRMNWQSFVRTRLPLLKLPEDILEVLRSGGIEYTKAKEIAKLELYSERQALLEEAIADSLSLSQIRERVKASQPPHDRGEFAARIDATTKRVKKSKVWENPSKRSRLESLLAQIEELIAEEGLDESQFSKEEGLDESQFSKEEGLNESQFSKEEGLDESQFSKEAEVTQELPQPTTKRKRASLIKSDKDTLESQKGVTEELSNEAPPLQEETASVPEEGETPSIEPLDESRLETEEETTQKDGEPIDELPKLALTHAEMAKRLGVKTSTLSEAKKKTNFAEWSKSKDPEASAWQWVAESKRFVKSEMIMILEPNYPQS